MGTNITGTSALANLTYGVQISGGSGNTIGGLTATAGTGAGNLISGNAGADIEITGAGSTGNLVAGDQIGTDRTGTLALANHDGVVLESGASANTIGGTTAGAGNLISGNTTYGVYITVPRRRATSSRATRSAPTPPAPPRSPTAPA
jgi:titin